MRRGLLAAAAALGLAGTARAQCEAADVRAAIAARDGRPAPPAFFDGNNNTRLYALVSGAHATLFATGAAVVGHLVPAEQAALDRLAHAATASRVWAGVHYPFDNEAGTRLGRQVAEAAPRVLDAEAGAEAGADARAVDR